MHVTNVHLLLGVTVSPLDETTYQIFAPSQLAMDEAKEMIDELLAEEVHLVGVYFSLRYVFFAS